MRAHSILLLLVLLALPGCGNLQGSWRMVRAMPNADTFSIREATFGDETYTATLTYEGRTLQQTGSYTFKSNKLRLQPDGGGMRTFGASVSFGELIIRDGDERKVILNKVGG